MREKLIDILRCGVEHHEELREKWIIGGKVGERPSIIKSFADLLVTNDVVQVVRCKDCKRWHKDTFSCDFMKYGTHVYQPNWYEEDFCCYGERKDNG